QTAVRRKSSTLSRSSEDVGGVEALRRAKPAGEAGASASESSTDSTGSQERYQFIIFFALILIADHIIGFSRFFEAVLRSLITRVFIRVVFPREFAICLLDVIGR